MKHMIPPHVWSLVAPYGLSPAAGEVADLPRADAHANPPHTLQEADEP
jgi:hypothetical protein